MIYSLLIEGITVGSIYAIAAIGFVMLFRSTGSINFAHGDTMMLSTFVAYALLVQFRLPLIIAIFGTLLFAGLLGIIVEKVIIKPLIDKSHSGVIIATLGLAFIFQGVAGIIWSDNVYPFPKIFEGDLIYIKDIAITPQSIGIVISSVIIISLLYFFLNHTKIGTGLRAVTQNKEAAALMGIKLSSMYSISWAIAGVLAAIAGLLLAPTLFLSTGMGSITFTAIIASIIGGFGNIFGAVIGGYLLGILQTVLPLYIPTELQDLIPFVLLMLVLFIKPTGILGKRTIKKV